MFFLAAYKKKKSIVRKITVKIRQIRAKGTRRSVLSLIVVKLVPFFLSFWPPLSSSPLLTAICPLHPLSWKTKRKSDLTSRSVLWTLKRLLYKHDMYNLEVKDDAVPQTANTSLYNWAKNHIFVANTNVLSCSRTASKGKRPRWTLFREWREKQVSCFNNLVIFMTFYPASRKSVSTCRRE